MRILGWSFTSIMLVMLLLSCSGSRTVTSPTAQPDLSTQNISSTAGQVCWGIWDVFIDPETASAEVVPIRGADFMINVVNFLQPPTAPTQLISIQIDPGGTDFSSGLVTCDVTIQHPLPGTKFGGFDVMGIVLDDWPGHPSPIDSSIIASMPPNNLLQNPDGWTRWWNQSEFTTYGTLFGYTEGELANHNWTSTHTLNAYKYFCDDLEAEDPFDPDPAARGFFSSESPGINSRRYVLQFPGTVFHFKYAINASWATPNPGAVAPYTADDFPPEANMAEAYKIKIVNNSSTAYYENESSFGGNLSLVIEVRDWQYDGNPDHADDEVQTITVASPTLFPAPAVLDLSEAYPVPGNTTAFRVPVNIDDVTPTGIEDQHVLVCVTSKHPTTYEPQIPGISGYEYPSGPLAAYAMIEVPILDGVSQSTWPTFRRFYDRQGRTDAIGPSTPNVLLEWTEPNGQIFFGGIALDSKGRAICHTNNLWCIDLSGEVIWSTYIQDNSYMTPTVGPDDSVYIATNPSSETCRLAHFDCNGEYVWSHDYNYGIMDCGPVFQDNGTILISTWDGILAKVNIMGNVIWDFETDGHAIAQGPAVGDDGTIYVSTHDDRVYAVSQGGEKLWMKDCGSSDMCATPALGPDGIFVGSMSGRMYCLNYNGGSVKWTTQVTGGCHSSVAVGDDGYIYFGTRKNWVYCLDQDTGNEKWKYETSDEIFTTTGVLDGADHLYIGNVAGDFYCFDTNNGDVVWVYNTGSKEIRCMSPAITDDGAVVVGTLGGKLFAFKDE